MPSSFEFQTVSFPTTIMIAQFFYQRTQRFVLPLASRLVLGLVFSLGFLGTQTNAYQGERPPVVQAKEEDSSRLSIENVVLKVTDERNIPCRVPGIIDTSEISEGTLLKESDLIMAVDDRRSNLELERLAKELEKSRREAATRVELEYQLRSIEVAQAELNRALLSNQRQAGSVAQSEIDQLNLLVQKAVAEKDKIEFQIKLKEMATEVRQIDLSLGERTLADHQIRSPINGMVVEVFKRPGEWVEVSETVCRVVRLDILRAEVKVPADLALDGLTGSEAVFIPKLKSLKGKAFPAKVIYVERKAEPLTTNVKVWVEIENSELHLIPGITGTVKIN